jgi:hypothetical protein
MERATVHWYGKHWRRNAHSHTKHRFRGLETMLASSLERSSGKSYDAKDESTLFSSSTTYTPITRVTVVTWPSSKRCSGRVVPIVLSI